jgi:hypothetical protein
MVSGLGADGCVLFIACTRSVMVMSLLYQGVRFSCMRIFGVFWSCVIGGNGLGDLVNSVASALATYTGLVRSLPPISRMMAAGAGG